MSCQLDALSFNLVDMPEDEVCDEIQRIDNCYVQISFDCNSEGDGDESKSKGSSAGDAPAAMFDHPDVAQTVVSDYEEDEPSSSGEWDAEDTLSLSTLAKRWKSSLVTTWNKCILNIDS